MFNICIDSSSLTPETLLIIGRMFCNQRGELVTWCKTNQCTKRPTNLNITVMDSTAIPNSLAGAPKLCSKKINTKFIVVERSENRMEPVRACFRQLGHPISLYHRVKRHNGSKYEGPVSYVDSLCPVKTPTYCLIYYLRAILKNLSDQRSHKTICTYYNVVLL